MLSATTAVPVAVVAVNLITIDVLASTSSATAASTIVTVEAVVVLIVVFITVAVRIAARIANITVAAPMLEAFLSRRLSRAAPWR